MSSHAGVTIASSRPRTARRPPLVAVVAAGLAVAALLAYAAIFAQLSDERRDGTDFTTSYVAAQLWRDGQGSRLYDQQLEISRHDAQMPPGYRVDLPFITPPTTALLAAPLTVLGLRPASAAAGLLELLAVAAAVALALRAAPRAARRLPIQVIGLVAVAGLGSYVTLVMGQWDGLCALALALGYTALRRGWGMAAGAVVAAGFLATKPHLAIGLGLFLIGLRQWRLLAGGALGVIGVLGLGAIVAGSHGWGDWVQSLGLSSGHSPLPSLLGFTGLFGSWLGEVPSARVLAGICSVLAVAACALLGDRVRRRPELLEPALAGATALSLVAAPHLLLHDLAVLAPAVAWTLVWAAGAGRLGAVAALWSMINLTALLDLGNGTSAPPGRLVPLALAAAGTIAIVATRTPGMASGRALRYSGSGSGVGGVVDQS